MQTKHHLKWLAALGLCAAVLMPQYALARKAMDPKAAKALSAQLDEMVGHDGTPVPGRGGDGDRPGRRV